MSRQNNAISYTVAMLWLVFVAPVSAGSITNFDNWTQVQDPPHSGMTGTRTSTEVTLIASGPVPAGTDIGYQSVDGNTVAGSSSGNYFSASQDFSIAVDFTVTASVSNGFAAIGFGIGEDSTGMNSAGPVLAILNGAPLGFAGGARTNDVSQTQLLPGPTLVNSGRFFVSYESISGDIIFGVNAIAGSLTPSHTGTFTGIQNDWNDKDLLASFFLRSDNPSAFSQLTLGTVSAVFSNFQVLAGTPISAVPLPAALWLFAAALGGLLTFRGRTQTTG